MWRRSTLNVRIPYYYFGMTHAPSVFMFVCSDCCNREQLGLDEFLEAFCGGGYLWRTSLLHNQFLQLEDTEARHTRHKPIRVEYYLNL